MGIVPTPESDRARFWAKVVKEEAERVPGLGPCWIWRAATFRRGYGAFRLHLKQRRAHIVSFEWHVGPTNGLLVCHRCDQPPCVNPAHLFLGTNQENGQDASDKGRLATGLSNGTHVAGLTILSADDVREIRRRCEDGERQQPLADHFGVTQTLISRIMTGKAWAHLFPATPKRPTKPRPSDETVRSIRGMVQSGLSYREVGLAHGCSSSAVWRIATRAAYPDVD